MESTEKIQTGSNLLYSQFVDVDHFIEHVELLMDVDLVQLEAGPLRISSRVFMLDDIAMNRYGGSKATFERFCLPVGDTLISFSPPQQYGSVICCGILTPPDWVGIIHAGKEYCSRNFAGFDVVEVMISNELLEEYGLTDGKVWQDTEQPEQAAFPLPDKRSIRFRNMLYSLFDNQSMLEQIQQDKELTAYFREWLLEETLTLLSTCLLAEESILQVRTKSRYDIFQQAVRLIDDQLRKPLSTGKLATQLGSSPRVVQYAFQENLQMTPLQYILTRKLHAARTALKDDSSDRHASISDTAMLYNISHFGRFSMQYKKMFGELPSATLQQANSTC